MALNVGENFKQRWLATPEAVRQTYCDELKFICALLEPETQIQKWQNQEGLLKQRNHQIIEKAYAQLKQSILAEQARIAEERKRQRQAELEQILTEKRQQQQAEIHAIELQEQLKQQQQTEYLHRFAQELQQTTLQQNAHIEPINISQAKQFNQTIYDYFSPVVHPAEVPQHEDLKTRLELEAEEYIEQTLRQFKQKLQAAAQEEIELILAKQQDF